MSTDYSLFEERGELKLNLAKAFLLTSLTPSARPNRLSLLLIASIYSAILLSSRLTALLLHLLLNEEL